MSMCVLQFMLRITKLGCRVLTQMTKFLIIVILVKLEKFAAIRLVRAPSLDNPGGHSFGRAEIIFTFIQAVDLKMFTAPCT